MAFWDTGAYGAPPGSTQIPGSTAASSLAGVAPRLNPNLLARILSVLGKIGKGVGQSALMVGKASPLGALVQGGEYGALSALGKTDSPWAKTNYFARMVQQDKERQAREALATRQGEATAVKTENENLLFPQKQRLGNLEISQTEKAIQELEQRIKVNQEALAKIEADKKAAPYDVRAQEALEFERKKRQNELDDDKAKIDELKSSAEYNRSAAGRQERWNPAGGRVNVLSVTEIDRQAAAYADRMYPKTWSGAARTPEWWTAYKEKSAELEGANKYPEAAGSGLGEGGSETDAQETPEESLANQVYDTYLAPIMPKDGSILEQQHAARQGLTKAIAAGVIKQDDVVYRLIVKQYKLPQ